jgi:hypothetical protein
MTEAVLVLVDGATYRVCSRLCHGHSLAVAVHIERGGSEGGAAVHDARRGVWRVPVRTRTSQHHLMQNMRGREHHIVIL